MFCSTLGKEVEGIWPEKVEEEEDGEILSCNPLVNCATLTHHGCRLATGDDDGFVKLFTFPVTEKHVRLPSF